MRAIYILICVVYTFFPLFSQINIKGIVIDAKTGDPLPFTNINIKSTTEGTISSADGIFQLRLTDQQLEDTVIFTYIGFKNKTLLLKTLLKDTIVKMEFESYVLKEVVVRPKPPIYYVKKALESVKVNCATSNFMMYSFYREMVKENNHFLSLEEGYFKSVINNISERKANGHQLLLHRQTEKLSELEFMYEKRQKAAKKKIKKDKKKAKKEGREYIEKKDSVKKSNIDISSFGGPDHVLYFNFSNIFNNDSEDSAEMYKDMEKIKFSFGNDLIVDGKNVMEINFYNKRKINHTKMKGKIYIEVNTFAIVLLEVEGTFKIPAYVKPILLVLGLNVINPTFYTKITNQEFQNKWYPKSIQWNMGTAIEKIHLFSKNEVSNFYIEQIFNVNKIVFDNIIQIDKSKTFDSSEKMEKQVHNDENLTWDDVNTIPLEIPKK